MAREGFLCYHEWLESLTPFGDAECGRLFRACLEYSMTGETPELSGNERFIWPTFAQKIDRDRKAYESKCRQNKENRTTVDDRQRSSTNVNDRQRTTTNDDEEARNAPTKPNQTKPNQTETKPEKRESAHARGAYGWVKLTDRQYDKLLEDLGKEEALRCIAYVDESAQSSGNKNKWSDWNLVVRRCSRDGWGLDNRNAVRPNKILTASAYKASQAGVSPLDMDAFDALVDRI